MRRGGKRSLESRIRRGLKRTCESKESFDNIKEAAIRAAFLLFNNGYFNSPYECRNCVKVHLTTKYKWDNESRAALEAE